jgi:hypothetical protein
LSMSPAKFSLRAWTPPGAPCGTGAAPALRPRVILEDLWSVAYGQAAVVSGDGEGSGLRTGRQAPVPGEEGSPGKKKRLHYR